MGEHYKVEVAGNRQPKQTVGEGGKLEEQVTVYALYGVSTWDS